MAGNHDTEPDDEAVSPADMLAVAEQQRTHTERALNGAFPGTFAAWGIAWLAGFGWLALTIGETAPLDIALGYALIGFFCCLVLAGIYTGVTLGHSTRGLRGNSQTAGAMYGWSWALGFTALSMFVGAQGRYDLPDDAIALLWSTGSGLVVGLLFLAGGALLLDKAQFAVGCWILLVNAGGGFAGIPGHYLVMSLAGGGGLLAAAVHITIRRRRSAAVELPA